MESKITRQLQVLFIVATGLFVFWTANVNTARSDEPQVRVAVLKDAGDLSISIRGAYEIIDSSSEQVLESNRRLKQSQIIAGPQGIMIGTSVYPTDHIRIDVKKDASLYVKNRRLQYRGKIDILRNPSLTFLVINIV